MVLVQSHTHKSRGIVFLFQFNTQFSKLYICVMYVIIIPCPENKILYTYYAQNLISDKEAWIKFWLL